ncbi:MAG TPA: response regulator [Polyangiaceae bacterium]
MDAPVDILLVDDEPRNLSALEAILSDPGYRLLLAEDADSALKHLLASDVAAIVLDIKMPGVSGFDLARMIKNTKRFRDTPIVFLTAHMVNDQDIIAGYGAGGVDYLTKPVNTQILRHKIGVFAELYRKTRELASVNAELAQLNEKLEERVSERTRELERSEAALREAAAQKDEFLAILAHELRNPLAPLRTGIDLLLRKQESQPVPGNERTLGAMNRQLDHLVRLIDDLLDVSRISRGLLELKRERIDLGALVEATVDSVRPWFEKRQQTLSTSAAPSVFAFADPTRVAQILTNLLHNATKFTPEGGSVRVELARSGEKAVLTVIDSGAGVSPQQRDRVFEMFARITRPGLAAEPGLGIGLALARHLAEMHGGTLTLASEGEGRGTAFSLSVPASTDGEASRPDAASGSRSSATEPLDIVVVEDNDDIAEVLRDWLTDLGHRVSVARDGRSGVSLIQNARPRLVICDLGLPKLDGLGVCREVRAFAADAQPTMVALTGWGREDDLRLSKEAGFDHHLVKPVAPAALQALLERVGAGRNGEKEAANAASK